MAGNKTVETTASVSAFINAVEDPKRRAECRKVAAMMRKATGKPGKMWGTSIVGFGRYHYRYASGREGDFMLTGFSPRKRDLTLYIMPGFSNFSTLMKKLGKYKTGKSCLYIRSLDDVDEDILQQLIGASVRHMREKYETA